MSVFFSVFFKVVSFVGLLPVLAACHISVVVYMCNYHWRIKQIDRLIEKRSCTRNVCSKIAVYSP